MRKGLLLLLWLLIVLILSVIPIAETDVGPKGIDKFIHFMIYGITASLFWEFLYDKIGGHRIIGIISVVAASLYGLLIEMIQSLLPYRSFSISDIIANFLGAVISVTILNIRPLRQNNRMRLPLRKRK